MSFSFIGKALKDTSVEETKSALCVSQHSKISHGGTMGDKTYYTF